MQLQSFAAFLSRSDCSGAAAEKIHVLRPHAPQEWEWLELFSSELAGSGLVKENTVSVNVLNSAFS